MPMKIVSFEFGIGTLGHAYNNNRHDALHDEAKELGRPHRSGQDQLAILSAIMSVDKG